MDRINTIKYRSNTSSISEFGWKCIIVAAIVIVGIVVVI